MAHPCVVYLYKIEMTAELKKRLERATEIVSEKDKDYELDRVTFFIYKEADEDEVEDFICEHMGAADIYTLEGFMKENLATLMEEMWEDED